VLHRSRSRYNINQRKEFLICATVRALDLKQALTQPTHKRIRVSHKHPRSSIHPSIHPSCKVPQAYIRRVAGRPTYEIIADGFSSQSTWNSQLVNSPILRRCPLALGISTTVRHRGGRPFASIANQLMLLLLRLLLGWRHSHISIELAIRVGIVAGTDSLVLAIGGGGGRLGHTVIRWHVKARFVH
jgi:hypothetical protein